MRCFFSPFSRLGGLCRWADSIGTNVSATNSEQSSEKVTTYASCLNMTPTMPRMKIIGKKTTTVVSVPAMMAAVTSSAPSTAACIPSNPFSSRKRVIFSSTTMALSTIMPTPSANPPSVMMFSVKPLK